MEEIFETLFEYFGSLAWWYALAQVIISWLGVILFLIYVIVMIACIIYFFKD